MVRLTVRVHPGARRERVEVRGDGGVEIWVRERAEGGKANAGLQKLLAARLALPPSAVQLVHGQAARVKVVDVPLDGALDRLRAGPPKES